MTDKSEFLTTDKPVIPDLLQELTAIVAVILDDQGFVIEANRGFRFIINMDETSDHKINVRELFVQPGFAEFVSLHSESNVPIYQGIMNIGDPNSYCRSVNGSVFRFNDKLLVVGEYDIADLERLNSTVIELNEELAQLQRDLVKVNRDLKRKEKKITQMMLTDPMTGIANRRHYEQKVVEEIQRHQRYKNPLSFAMGDIDLFKSVNDTYGHDVGDVVINRFAHCLRDSKRASDFVARVGGEEFILIMPHTTLEQAHLVIDRIRKLFSEEKYDAIERAITASFGVTELKENDTPECLVKRSDQGLYEAKETGRNKVVSHP